MPLSAVIYETEIATKAPASVPQQPKPAKADKDQVDFGDGLYLTGRGRRYGELYRDWAVEPKGPNLFGEGACNAENP